MFCLKSFLTFLAAVAKVQKLTADNFDTVISENSLVLVKFTAPWCGHCKALNPEFEAASDTAVDEDYCAANGTILKDVVFADVDVTEEEKLATRFKISGYPTIKFFRDGVPEEYDGGRTQDTIMQWVIRNTKDALIEAETCTEHAEKNPGESIVCITYSNDSYYEKAKKIADGNRLSGISYISVKGEEDKATMHRHFDATPIVLDIESSADFITSVKTERLPFFGPVSGETFSNYMETGLDFVWMAGNKEQMDSFSDNMIKLGKAYRGQLNFVWLDSDQFQRQAEGMLGISSFPALVRTIDGPGRFIFNGDYSNAEELMKWVDGMQNGSLKPELKSEEIPETNDEAVKVVVGKQFNDIVVDDRDVMLEIYAPWCGHCKKLAPIYDEVATKLSEIAPAITIAKMDGTANEIAQSGYEFQGFPTIYWKAAGQAPVLYSGGRELDDLMTFLSEKATTPFTWTVEKKEAPVEDDEL